MAANLKDQIREYRIEKEKRYAEYRDLLAAAVAAGESAAVAAAAGRRRRGAVWVQLVNGRSSFRQFLLQEEVPGWRRGNRKMKVFLSVDFRDFDRSLAYARAFAGVLDAGGVPVTVEYKLVTEGDH